jgi:hypothetical protein
MPISTYLPILAYLPLEIEMNENTMNKDEGLKISEAWKHVLLFLKINNNPNN